TASISGDTLTAYAGGVAVFTLSLHTDGSWEFDLLAPVHHNPAIDDGTNDNTLDLSSLVKAVDYDGDSVALSDDFKIIIRDDAPVANDDTNSLTANTIPSVDGNVISGGSAGDVADNAGADGISSIAWTGAAAGSIAGAHGTLTVDANGHYTYTINNSDPAVS